jgi:hypothetical protein
MEDKRAEALAFIKPVEQEFPKERKHELSEACYTFSETNVIDDMSIDEAAALRIWAMVETVRRRGFPNELRM